MAINKNFVIKNGLEVNTGLIVADSQTNKVGIGTTIIQYTLHVNGGIGATDFFVSGISTIATLQSNTGTITNLTVTDLFSGVGTIGRVQSTDINNIGVITSTTLNISGTGTIAVGVVTFLSGTNLNYSGISTLGVTSTTNLTSQQLNVSGISTLGVTSTTNLTSQQLNVSGISTLGVTSATNFTSQQLNVSGISTLGVTSTTNFTSQTLNISGISTFSSVNTGNINIAGIVTGLNVSGVSTFSSVNTGNINIAGIVTGLNVSGISTFSSVNTGNINIAGIVTGLNVSGVSTFSSVNTGNINIAGIVTGLNVSGISTFSSVNTGNINIAGIVTGLNVSGVSTLGTIKISSGIITATSGVVTYFGDGSNLTGLAGNPSLQTVLGVGNASTIGMSIVGVVTATDFDALSDENYKKNVITVNNALNKVEQLRGVSFDWKGNGRSSYGVIAQELQKVLPELVHGDDPKTVNYNGIIGVLIEAIKELKKEIEELKYINNKE